LLKGAVEMAFSPLGLLTGPAGLKIVGIAFLAMVIGFSAYIVVQKIEIGSLHRTVEKLTEERNFLDVDNKILKENNTSLKDGLKKLAVANETNYNTAKSLLDERNKSVTAINNLAIANRLSNQKLDRLNTKIEDMLKDPKNDGPVAPVLREVIREIQKERAR
jgi:hypothetical protein